MYLIVWDFPCINFFYLSSFLKIFFSVFIGRVFISYSYTGKETNTNMVIIDIAILSGFTPNVKSLETVS